MPKLTALIHTHNDARRIGRLLESLRPCDEVLVVDHDSQDDTDKIAREHGARVVQGMPGVRPGTHVVDASHDWIFCLLPSEALSEALEASLFEWKDGEPDQGIGFSVRIRQETAQGWKPRAAERRLVNRMAVNWTAELPPHSADVTQLAGDLLRFRDPQKSRRANRRGQGIGDRG